jgi:hypothetical protein
MTIINVLQIYIDAPYFISVNAGEIKLISLHLLPAAGG